MYLLVEIPCYDVDHRFFGSVCYGFEVMHEQFGAQCGKLWRIGYDVITAMWLVPFERYFFRHSDLQVQVVRCRGSTPWSVVEHKMLWHEFREVHHVCDNVVEALWFVLRSGYREVTRKDGVWVHEAVV